jgi:cytochrome c-type biogenesis protein CcmH
MNYLFIACAMALTVAVVLALAPVLWRGWKAEHVAHGAVNAAVLRDQLVELERDRASGTLSAVHQEQAKQELQRRVLDEVTVDVATSNAVKGSKGAALALSTLLPLAAFTAYFALGNPAALSPQAERSAPVARADVEAMVASLENKLKRNPDDPEGWAMLARSYRAFARHEDAAKAFERAGAVVDIEPQLLAEYAETLAINRNGDLNGEPTNLLERALKLDPQHPFALALAGSAAFARADYAAAIEYWQPLHAQLLPESEPARTIAERIEKARSAQHGQPKPPL